MPEMLADGTNPEGVDPEPPLGWKDKSSFKDVELLNMEASPPCAKIRYHLSYAGIPYTVLTSSDFKKKYTDKVYSKVPVLVVDGRQVNDSYIIVKNLVPALYGTPFNDEWERKTTYGLQLAMEVEAFEDKANWPILVTFGGAPSWVATWFGCLLPLPTMARGIRARRAKRDEMFGPLRTAKEYLDDFKKEMGSSTYFGGSAPGAVDVSVFGTMAFWKELPLLKALLEDCQLTSWFQAMEEKMPKEIVGN
eukprot:CAMPEP_0178436152 /NCGR_PEP_ID=MMETSP0689_2-20121128/34293_1 /TAXON_ID=160604 /ORGANISM="Amphidinium massartii, Strain CS-259" /LENGTH=248 /DNA_ID=CAMNT_0020058241 /DNA_START=1 /DNA_END=747 /DNA_ORIENTATION=-